MKTWGLLFILGSLIFLQGCYTEDKDIILAPNNGLHYGLYPNDQAQNDSVSAGLAYGTYLMVHPKGTYTLSFAADSSFSPPVLQLHRITLTQNKSRYFSKRVRSLKPIEKDGRFVYSFTCEEPDPTMWATTLLGEGDTYYQGKVNRVLFEGDGPYSESFNLNLIVTGLFEETADGLSEKQLASKMLAAFRKSYEGIAIDTIYIRHAENHPTAKDHYPADEPWLAGTSSPDVMLSELGGWVEPGVHEALDLVLVHRIDQNGILGYSPLFGANLGGGENSTVVLGAYMKRGGSEEQLHSDRIIETAIHETGHFFGLRHTTSTIEDMNAMGDNSSFEDGIEDTEWCEKILFYGLSQKGANKMSDIFVRRPFVPKIYAGVFDFDGCPDAPNIMFPYVTATSPESFSDGQLSIIRKNLSLFLH